MTEKTLDSGICRNGGVDTAEWVLGAGRVWCAVDSGDIDCGQPKCCNTGESRYPESLGSGTDGGACDVLEQKTLDSGIRGRVKTPSCFFKWENSVENDRKNSPKWEKNRIFLVYLGCQWENFLFRLIFSEFLHGLIRRNGVVGTQRQTRNDSAVAAGATP